jgi:lysophospholipase L1-like esterase
MLNCSVVVHPRPRRALAVASAGLVSFVAVGCGGASEQSAVPVATVSGVGVLPGPVTAVLERPNSAAAASDGPDGVAASATEGDAPVRPADLDLPTVGDLVDGNRVIVIGDSILASTAPRFGGSMCDRLTSAGWTVEIDAEPGRFLRFADTVLDRRLEPGDGTDWDAAVLFFGSNFDGDRQGFTDLLDDILERLAPRPVVLLTVTEFRSDRSGVNEIIRSASASGAGRLLIDWARITAAEPRLLSGDGLHLSEAGRNRIVTEVALALGAAPTLAVDGDGECLPSDFTDDELPEPDAD